VRRAEPPVASRNAARADAVHEIERELETWRERAVPDPSMPLEADGEDLGDVREAVFEAERGAITVLV